VGLGRSHTTARNYGVRRVERLEGDVGYLDLTLVADASAGARTIAAAMELIANTDALIIDLRSNRGASGLSGLGGSVRPLTCRRLVRCRVRAGW